MKRPSALPALFLLLLSSFFLPGPGLGIVDEPEPWEERFFTVLLSEQERAAYGDLSEQERVEYRRIYWAEKDPTPTTEANEWEQEHQRRVLRVIGTFRDADDRFLWDDRARAAIRFGFPERSEELAGDDERRREIWLYGKMILWFEESGGGFFTQMLSPNTKGAGAALARPGDDPLPESRERMKREFARLDLEPPAWEERAGRGAETWRDFPVVFPDEKPDGGRIDFPVGVYSAAGNEGSDLIITVAVPGKALPTEAQKRGWTGSVFFRMAVRDEAYRLVVSEEGTRMLRGDPSIGEGGGVLLTDSLVVPPGPARVSVSMEGPGQRDAFARTILIHVPDFSGDSIRLTNPIVASTIRRLSGGEGSIERRGNRIVPRPGAVFFPDEKAWVYFEINNLGIGRDGRSHFTLSYTLEGAKGGELSCLLGGDEGGKLRMGEEKRSRMMSREASADRRVSLGLSSLPPGEYRLVIRAADEANGAEDETAALFRVVRR